MKFVVLLGLSTAGMLFVNAASATSHPRPCTYLRDLCKSTSPAAVCDKAYQEAIANNGAWNGPLYSRRANDSQQAVTNCAL
jgi:hypothetical protein